MKNLLFLFGLPLLLLLTQCKKSDEFSEQIPDKAMSSISEKTVNTVIKSLLDKYGENAKFRIERGVKQAASLWADTDGDEKQFEEFCNNNFIGNEEDVDLVFDRLSTNFESLFGHLNKITLDLNRPLHLDIGKKLPIDEIFGAYSPSAHLTDDFFTNKIAFSILLNFPHYSLQEKTELGANWTRKQWAYARMGDMFNSRVPAAISQKISEVMTNADTYISDYNIYVGYLVDDASKTYFPKDLKLISHWNLRDELKSQYGKEDGLVHQKMIYEVMNRIITQEIPDCVINSDKYQWNPFKNKVFQDGKEIQFKPEPDTRYKHLLNNFHAQKAADPYCPNYPTYIKRSFDEGMEIPQEQVEKMFTDFISSLQVKQVADLIAKRLGRKLEPFDIWYDGFKARSTISEDELNKITMKKYPNPEALQKDLPNILIKLGYTKEKADYITSKIVVDPSRGAGHAWGAEMKSEKAHLRTRIGSNGMDYKGYNIAIHEFGHNVEQTLTLQDVDYYMLRGVPNTAFTEAWAFVFQKRDLELLGIKDNDPNKDYLLTLDNFWSAYEIMGVSLVDMNVWKWLYKNPEATEAELKETVIKTAKDIWNKYYAPVFGVKDQPILAIYSHMIDYPLYLSNYPVGHLIEFQMDQYMTGKNLGTEMYRICTQGRLIPNIWMQGAVGSPVSIEPTLKATEEALKHIN